MLQKSRFAAANITLDEYSEWLSIVGAHFEMKRPYGAHGCKLLRVNECDTLECGSDADFPPQIVPKINNTREHNLSNMKLVNTNTFKS